MRFKRLLSLFIAMFVIIGSVVSSANAAAVTLKSYAPTSKYVKYIGRTYLSSNVLWLAHSGTGAEFTFKGTKAIVTLVGDNTSAVKNNDTNYARYAIYVNNKLVKDGLMDKSEKKITVLNSESSKTNTIKILKLSESANSTLGIKKISVSGTKIQPTKAKELLIEFIGDSITCGYGVDDPNKNHHFSTATEDFTKTYAYKTATALKADYSAVSFSGYGIISGYTSNTVRNENQILSKYYDKVGFSYGKFAGTKEPSSIAWSFKNQPDVVVINLGTNDDSYVKNDSVKQEEYVKGYTAFLKQVREKNPEAKILCTLGIMGDSLFSSLEKAVNEYKSTSKDENVSTMKFDVQLAKDGYGADWHPSEATHKKAAEKLTAEIKKLLENTKTTEDDTTNPKPTGEVDTSWIDPTKKLVAFTFDDGPIGTYDGSASMKILDVLEKYKMHSTFFYIGNKINDNNKAEIERAFNLGCEIGNHTFSHPYLSKLSESDMTKQIEDTSKLLTEITGLKKFLVRPPYGDVNAAVQQTVKAPLILWSVDSADWNKGTYESVVNNVKNKVKDGSIVLMHENYNYTAQAVEYLVPYFIEQGYQIVSVSELMAMKGTQMTDGQKYWGQF